MNPKKHVEWLWIGIVFNLIFSYVFCMYATSHVQTNGVSLTHVGFLMQKDGERTLYVPLYEEIK